MGWMSNEEGLEKCRANHVPLSPLSHLQRAAKVFPDVLAVSYGAHRISYAQYHARCSRLAAALNAMGVAPGEVVATVLPNIPAQAEAHFGVPACGAVLNTINTRLDVDTVAYILDHDEAKIVLADTQFLDMVEAACAALATPPRIIEVPDPDAGFPATGRHMVYDDLLATGDPDFAWIMPQDEWESLALLYLGHNGASQRRGLSPPRGLSDDDGDSDQLAHGAASRLYANCTAVSLQRLEPHMDDATAWRDVGVLSRYHRRRNLQRDCRRRGDPFWRGTDCVEHDGKCLGNRTPQF